MFAEIRKSNNTFHKGYWEVAEHWDDGCTIAVRYFKTKKEANKYFDDEGYGGYNVINEGKI